MEFWEKHPDSEQALKTWYAVVSKASWSGPAEMKLEQKRNASLSS
jgi:mRNA interferase HigB